MKWRRQPMIGVYFRIPDDEPVRFGHYFRGWVPMRAAQAVAAIRAEADPRGFQIILGRSIPPKDIARIAPVRGVIGWRHKPDAHGQKPCGCPACMARGEPGGVKIRRAWERAEREADEAWARAAASREAAGDPD
ncbi:MAG: hypothetical protein JNJ73_20495 [Hyphomonadaceae bacterium]|nr:hypothetical protein [Hyphomonadaceae bacterium]